MPGPMTEDELRAIEARALVATPGDWFADPDGISYETDGGGGVLINAFGYDCLSSDDEAFIVSARADVPALVAEVRRLRALCPGHSPETPCRKEGP